MPTWSKSVDPVAFSSRFEEVAANPHDATLETTDSLPWSPSMSLQQTAGSPFRARAMPPT